LEISIWETSATEVAEDIRQKHYPFRRGLICIPCPTEEMVIAWLLGNGEPVCKFVEHELKLIREHMENLGLEELGFGVSADRCCWAIAAKADNRRFQTEPGKALHLQLLKIDLNHAIRTAWEATLELRAGRINGTNVPRKVGQPFIPSKPPSPPVPTE
jgi:hypothetical protein